MRAITSTDLIPGIAAQQGGGIADALKLLRSTVAFSSADWGDAPDLAIVYAVLVGWDCEEGHPEHDDICGGTEAMDQNVIDFAWSPEFVVNLRRHRAAVRALVPEP